MARPGNGLYETKLTNVATPSSLPKRNHVAKEVQITTNNRYTTTKHGCPKRWEVTAA